MDIRKNIFLDKTVNYWNSLPREVVESLFLEVFKATLDGDLGSLV